MVLPASHKTLEIALRQLQAEKERSRKVSAEDRKRLEQAEEKLQRKLRTALRKKKELEEKASHDDEDLERIKEAVAHEAADAEEERRLFKLQQRIEDFRGNDTEEVRDRLIAEGFDPRLVDVTLRRRTLDASLERPGGLQAKFSHLEDAVTPSAAAHSSLAAIYSGTAQPEQLADQRVLEHIYMIQNEQQSKGYLSEGRREFLNRFEDLASRAQEQASEYRTEPQQQYLHRATSVIESIRERDEMEHIKRSMGMDTTVGGMYKERERNQYQRSTERRDQL